STITFLGGGVATDITCVISNCIITGNTSFGNGGGAYLGASTILINSIVSGNTTFGGGQGGAADGNGFGSTASTLLNCVVSNNIAGSSGGIASCAAYNCLLVGNRGNAAYLSTLNNCTLTGNFSPGLGTANGCTLNNS